MHLLPSADLYNVRRPLKDVSSEEFVMGVQSDKEISMPGSTPKTNYSELRSLSGHLTLYISTTKSRGQKKRLFL